MPRAESFPNVVHRARRMRLLDRVWPPQSIVLRSTARGWPPPGGRFHLNWIYVSLKWTSFAPSNQYSQPRRYRLILFLAPSTPGYTLDNFQFARHQLRNAPGT